VYVSDKLGQASDVVGGVAAVADVFLPDDASKPVVEVVEGVAKVVKLAELLSILG